MTVTLTGKQNSSKAGLTNVVYWLRICSRSLPRFMSRRTTETNLVTLLTGYCNIWNIVCVWVVDIEITSARQSDIWICVHKELHVEHIPHFLRVEDQNPLKEDHICWVNCDPVFQPGNRHMSFIQRQLWWEYIVVEKRMWNVSCLPGMSDEVICWHLNHPSLHYVL